jgi:pre-rRNA-processing protein TSR4
MRFRVDAKSRPLWVTRRGRCREADVPACERCGAARTFEFQVMPQLLFYLGLDEIPAGAPTSIAAAAAVKGATPHRSVDWGTLVVFTCSKSCGEGSAGEAGYAPEFIWRQPLYEQERRGVRKGAAGEKEEVEVEVEDAAAAAAASAPQAKE